MENSNFMRDETKKLPKLIVILGPTACGKTSWSLELAKKYNGEIISADSRQIYKEMNIGTAKEPGEWRWNGLRRTYFIEDIPHHMIDFLSPGKRFTVAEFRDKALKYTKLAYKYGRIPLLVGGTGLYIQAVVDNFSIPRVSPNKKLRSSLEEKNTEELHNLLKQMDPTGAEKVDKKNKRRLIRALEVCILTGEPFSQQKEKGEQLFDVLQIGIDVPREVLYERIDKRVDEMMKHGLLKEVEDLVKKKFSWDLPSMSGIGYKEFRCFFEKKCKLDDVIHNLKRNTRQYARRQMSWFRRDKRITWRKNYNEAEELVQVFLKK